MSTPPPVLSIIDRLPQATTNKEAVAILESFLADARAGRIIAVAVAGVTEARTAETASSGASDYLLLLGAISRLQARFNACMDDMEDVSSGPPGPAA